MNTAPSFRLITYTKAYIFEYWQYKHIYTMTWSGYTKLVTKTVHLLQFQKVALPDEVEHAEVTSLCYNTRRILYTGTNSGRVCVWDCDTQRCFVTWEADEGEIGACDYLLFS